jgi:predicted nucleotidyltransferase
MDDEAFTSWLASELAGLPGVDAVALGGSRAHGTHRPDSDWDLAVYYRRGSAFAPDDLRSKGWAGVVSEIGGWGGGVMNGGAWLTIDGRRVDVHYRDLDEVEHWCAESRAGRFQKQHLLFYVAGIPTYVPMGELALNRVFAGELSAPEFPDALAEAATRRWHADAVASAAYAEAAWDGHGDVVVALGNAARALVEESHSRLSADRVWVLNEKGITARAGLGEPASALLAANDDTGLRDALAVVRAAVGA